MCLAFWLFPRFKYPHILNPRVQVPGDVGEHSDPTLVVLQPLKAVLQLGFFITFLLFQFVAMSLKIVELNCSFLFHNGLITLRQPLNNHTRPFYLPEFLSKVQNTARRLSGMHEPGGGGGGACRLHGSRLLPMPGYAAKVGACETSTQIPRDVSILVGY